MLFGKIEENPKRINPRILEESYISEQRPLRIEYGCYVDNNVGASCVMVMVDGDIEDCEVALSLAAEGKDQTSCHFWLKKCGHCGGALK